MDSPVEVIKPPIVGLKLGEIRHDVDNKPQVYLGGESVSLLTHIGTASLRGGAVEVDMYTIDGTTEADYAMIRVMTPASTINQTQRAAARRGGGLAVPLSGYIERTPMQHFTSRRTFTEIPISGVAQWIAVSPDGKQLSGSYSSRNPKHNNTLLRIGQGWTFSWIAEGSTPFVFGELCTPRFIDTLPDCPKGEDGIVEFDNDPHNLPQEFTAHLAMLTSGVQLDNNEQNRQTRSWVYG